MPEPNIIHIQFIAESGQLSAEFAKVNAELAKLGSDGGNFGAPIAEGAKKVTGAAKEGAEHLGLFGKQADKVKDQFKDFGKEALSTATKFIGLAAAFEVVKHAFEAAGALETARMHLKNILGGEDKTKEVIEDLEKHGVASPEMMEQAGRMAAAGVSSDKLGETLRSLRNIAKSTGSDLGGLVDIYDRIALRGEVTAREMIQITMASGGATRALAQEYSHLKPNLELANLASEKAALEQENLFKKNEKQIAAVDSLNVKVGFSSAVFKEWEKNMSRASVAHVEGFGGTAVLGMSTKQIAEFNEGIRAIAAEWGISEEAVRRFVQIGKIEMSDLIERGKEARVAAQEASAERSKAAEVENTAAEKRREVEIFHDIQTALGDASTTEAAFAEQQKTFAGQVGAQMKKIDEVFEKVGKPLIDNFQAIEIAVGGVIAVIGVLKAVEFGKGIIGVAGLIAKAFQGTTAAIEGTKAAEEGLAAVQGVEGAGAGALAKAAPLAAGGAAEAGGLAVSVVAFAPAIITALASAIGVAVLLKTTSQDPALNAQADAQQKVADVNLEYAQKQSEINSKFEAMAQTDENIQKWKDALAALDKEHAYKALMAKPIEGPGAAAGPTPTIAEDQSGIGEPTTAVEAAKKRLAPYERDYVAPIAEAPPAEAAAPAAETTAPATIAAPAAAGPGRALNPDFVAAHWEETEAPAGMKSTSREGSFKTWIPDLGSQYLGGPSEATAKSNWGGPSDFYSTGGAKATGKAGESGAPTVLPGSSLSSSRARSPGEAANSINGVAVSSEAAETALRENRFAHRIDPYTATNKSIDYPESTLGAPPGPLGRDLYSTTGPDGPAVSAPNVLAGAAPSPAAKGDSDPVVQGLKDIKTILSAILGSDERLVGVFTS